MSNPEPIRNLTENEARERLKKEGANELPSQKKRSLLILFWNVLKEPMLLLLIACGTIYFVLGEFGDAIMLTTFVFVVIGITFFQERKTERALESLRDLSSPRALVIRDNMQRRIAGREVVREDVIILREGDRIPADAIVLSATNLTVNESLLTGESVSVRKHEWDGKAAYQRPGGDGLPFVYSGTMIVSGHGIARVTSIGVNTEMGRIGKALEQVREEDTLLQKETSHLVRNFAIAGLILCVLVILIYTAFRGNILNAFLSGLTLSMSILPEEIPVVLLIFLTMGAWRISKSHVLTRNRPAIETLGATTVLCVDKTGTLTLNCLELSGIFSNGTYIDVDGQKTSLPEPFHDLLEYGILASQNDPFDPIEKELKLTGERFLSGTEHIHKNWSLIKEYEISKELLSISHVWESPDKQNFIIAAKGAPEAIVNLCHLNDQQIKELQIEIERMSKLGQRILGVAKASFQKTSLPPKQHAFAFEFIGLLGFADPVRPGVPESVKEAYAAGIRVIMITGDYPGTAQYVANRIGLKNSDQFITGPELAAMSEDELIQKIGGVNIFARVVPEQKLAIIKALKTNREIVAMTGDGVNDAPALKSAHIGVAMGKRGTDVARESASLVLLNDDFTSIVTAVRLGRRIFANLKKAISFTFAVHIPIAGMSLLPILFNLPLVLLPAHIAFLELIIDPACSMVFEAEPEEEQIMTKPPRNLLEPLFDRQSFLHSSLQGISVLVVVFIVFVWALFIGKGEPDARTLAFTVLVFANLMLIITNLSWSQNIVQILRQRNLALWFVLGGTLTALYTVLNLPFLQILFHFKGLHFDDLITTISSGLLVLFWLEWVKRFRVRPG